MTLAFRGADGLMTPMRVWVEVLAVIAMGCLPRVGPAADAGSMLPIDLVDGGPVEGCSDSLMNNTETDVDCGGLCPASCATGSKCRGPLDCESGVCVKERCVTPVQSCAGFAGCTTFVDLTAGDASRVVTFPVGGQEVYSPKCIKVRFGQSVTFTGGSFGAHPFDAACQPTSGPLSRVAAGSSASFVFDQALGVYGYFCSEHGSVNGSGMAGAVMVVR